MSLQRNPLRSLISERPVLGTFLKLRGREVVEIAARAGFDFAICDLHAGLPIIVRVAALDSGQINRLLEAGAVGIQLPHMQHRTEVSALRSAGKYAPVGSRSISLAQPAAAYGSKPLTEYIHRANEEVLLVGQLETRDLERPLEQLVEGLDVAFIGVLDLSVDMGVPGCSDDPAMVRHIAEIQAAAKSARVHTGIYADTPARAAQALSAGYRYIALSSDLGALSGTFKSWIKQLRSLPNPSTNRPGQRPN